MPSQTIFVGDTLPSNQYGDFVVIAYKNAHEIYVRFLNTGSVVKTKSSHIKSGLVKDRYAPTLYGIGVIGDKHPTMLDGKPHPVYVKWAGMFERCYGGNDSTESYRRNCVTVAEDFHSYEKFYEFFTNLPNSDKTHWNLDKDLKGGSEYSPETVCLLPPEINMALVCITKRNSSGLPGVRRSGEKFTARIMLANDERHIGTFATQEEAYHAYRVAKNKWVIELTEKYSEHLESDIVNLLQNWFPPTIDEIIT
jgi:hypothetical protein